MKRNLFLAALMLFALPVLAFAQAAQQRQVPTPFPVMKDLGGRVIRLSDYKGKVLLVNFWATWCPPCRAEMPDLIKLQREYGKRGLQIVGITYPPEKRALVLEFTRSIKVNYPIALGTREMKMLFDASEILPLTIVIDREGLVRERIEGLLLPEEFEEKIKPLLQSAVAGKSAANKELECTGDEDQSKP